MASVGELHMLNTCPFTWKVRSLLSHLNIEYDPVFLNPLKIKKGVSFAGDWGKTPVWRTSTGEVVVDSTPIMKHIDAHHNGGRLWAMEDEERRNQWLGWADSEVKDATIPILYGSIGAALSTTRSVAKHERFGLISGRLYAWAGFPIMWGIIAKKRARKTGMNPKELWHHLLDQWCDEMGSSPFFGGESPHLVDIVVHGYMSSIELHPKAFRHISSHERGMDWFKRVSSSCMAE